MIRYDIEKLAPGMIVGEAVYDHQQKMLVGKGFILKEQHISVLQKHKVATLLIEVEGTEEVIPETVVSQETRNELTKVLEKSEESIGGVVDQKKLLQQHIQKVLKEKKSLVNEIVRSSGSQEAVQKVIDDIVYEEWTLINLDKILHSGNDIYDHAINLTIVSTCLGYKFGLNRQDLKELALGAINADIGLTVIPKEIIEKGKNRTEEEERIYRNHTIYGYLILAENNAIAPTSSIVALSHHEHQNGSGYPQGLKGNNAVPLKRSSEKGKIHRFAEIVSVADKYLDLLHSSQSKGTEVDIDTVLRELISMKETVLNIEILKKLLVSTALYPVGSQIRVKASPLENLEGAFGVVAKVLPGKSMKPVVILVESKTHTKLPSPVVLDLSEKTGFSIELVI